MELNIVTPDKFATEVENLVWDRDIPYIDAVLLFCEQHNLEIETAASLINNSANIKAKIQEEGEDLNFLPKVNRLPI
jgi:hypothetical protein